MKCAWKYHKKFDVFITACERAYRALGSLEYNGFKYCPFCGKKIK